MVGRALQAVIDRDLATASLFVCPEQRDPSALPFDIGPVFLPLASLGDLDAVVALALVTITPIGLSAEAAELGDGSGSGTVTVRGQLDLQYDVEGVRAYAIRQTEGMDQGLVERVMLITGDGHLSLGLNKVVPVQDRGGVWMVCPGLGG